jgi:hypothetical protein
MGLELTLGLTFFGYSLSANLEMAISPYDFFHVGLKQESTDDHYSLSLPATCSRRHNAGSLKNAL